MLNVVVIDRNETDIEDLTQMLETCDGIQMVGKYSEMIDECDFISKLHIDAIFIDISIPCETGIQVVKLIQQQDKDISVIFTSNNSCYAAKAFELAIFDYLMKPVSRKRLEKTINRLLLRNC